MTKEEIIKRLVLGFREYAAKLAQYQKLLTFVLEKEQAANLKQVPTFQRNSFEVDFCRLTDQREQLYLLCDELKRRGVEIPPKLLKLIWRVNSLYHKLYRLTIGAPLTESGPF